MPNGIPTGFQMAEKKLNKQTNKHFRIYNSRDINIAIDVVSYLIASQLSLIYINIVIDLVAYLMTGQRLCHAPYTHEAQVIVSTYLEFYTLL